MFYLLEKLATAARAKTRETLESGIDANALRILGQEIYDSEQHIRDTKQHLAHVMADKVKLERQLAQAQRKPAEQEALIHACLQHNDETQATLLAEELVQQETFNAELAHQIAQLQTYEQRLLQTLKTTAHNIEHYRAQLRMAQATQHAQHAMGKLTKHRTVPNNTFANMQDSLARIQRQQTAFEDNLNALQQIDTYLAQETVTTQKIQTQQHITDTLNRLRPQP